ncbi:hypothetical protein D3C72_1599420 [compost metagenome]
MPRPLGLLAGKHRCTTFNKMRDTFAEVIASEAFHHLVVGQAHRFGQGLERGLPELPLHHA